MKKLLIVEDDAFLKNMEIIKFTQGGFEVIHAGTKDEYNTAMTQNPDIILLDLMLPDIDGYDILKTLRADEKTKKLPVVVFSNLAEGPNIEKAMACGATDFLIKAQCTLDEAVDRLKEF